MFLDQSFSSISDTDLNPQFLYTLEVPDMSWTFPFIDEELYFLLVFPSDGKDWASYLLPISCFALIEIHVLNIIAACFIYICIFINLKIYKSLNANVLFIVIICE